MAAILNCYKVDRSATLATVKQKAATGLAVLDFGAKSLLKQLQLDISSTFLSVIKIHYTYLYKSIQDHEEAKTS